jgi:ABC-2 type transport system ATP-binding protein
MKTLLGKLHVETFVLDLSRPVSESPVLTGYDARLLDASTLEVEVEKTEGLNRLFEQLARNSIDVLSMRNKSNRLEELFLGLVEANDRE